MGQGWNAFQSRGWPDSKWAETTSGENHYSLSGMAEFITLFFLCQSADADILAGPAEARRSKSKGQDRNELHEREKWCKACRVSVQNPTQIMGTRATFGAEEF